MPKRICSFEVIGVGPSEEVTGNTIITLSVAEPEDARYFAGRLFLHTQIELPAPSPAEVFSVIHPEED